MTQAALLGVQCLCSERLHWRRVTMSNPTITASFGEPIKQHPGQIQVDRAVVVDVPGKHFHNLTPAEAKLSYTAEAKEYRR